LQVFNHFSSGGHPATASTRSAKRKGRGRSQKADWISSPAVLKEDMIISIDIPMFNAPWGGLRVENGYHITAEGAEPLHDTPYWIQK